MYKILEIVRHHMGGLGKGIIFALPVRKLYNTALWYIRHHRLQRIFPPTFKSIQHEFDFNKVTIFNSLFLKGEGPKQINLQTLQNFSV
ncbi:hypothetical protein GDO86_006509 [Hymenochirus boettgeri]|uniref:Uncharacterized protein n=1 Tax=Hymenochirus boettgeri TaxID=247094 RepID=A0A8T2JBD8_9PIPI|nr:hypothetical protein GDO86_006509 [Hymenochirus boettgeri]